MSADTPAARAAARLAWQANVYRLGQEPTGDDLSAITTPEQRFMLVGELTAWMWELSGQPLPTYARSAMPVRVMRRP